MADEHLHAPPSTSHTASDLSTPLRDRLVDLRPVLARDHELLYFWANDSLTTETWRYRGATPSPEAFARSLWDGVLAQYLVVSRKRPEPFGLVGLYNSNLASGYAYAYALSAPHALGSGLAVRGLLLLADIAFRRWPLRCIYVETTSRALGQFVSARSALLEEVARIPEHERNPSGGFDDLVTLRLSREMWDRYLMNRGSRRRSS